MNIEIKDRTLKIGDKVFNLVERISPIEEKDWDVIELIADNRATTKYEQSNTAFETKDHWLETFLKSIANWQIKSIKYLPTGDIFELGKKAKAILTGKEFIIDTIDVSTGRAYLMNIGVLCPLENASLVEERVKLFTSIDGVDIFEGDRPWVIGENYYQIYQVEIGITDENCKDLLLFSTEEKAQEYKKKVFEKKFSAQDILDAIQQSSNRRVDNIMNVNSFKEKLGI